MNFKIKRIAALAPNLAEQSQWQCWANQPDFSQAEVNIPKLDFIPMMQRRRLSQFARLSFYTLHQLAASDALAIVFTSRFGDLEKTTELVGQLAEKNALSPTQFGLSVHNAVAGQWSIFRQNTMASTTISAGFDSFHMGLVEAYARLTQSEDDELIMLCTEIVPPALYGRYIEEQQIEHSVAILLSKSEGQSLSLNLTTDPLASAALVNSPLPQALQFMAWYYGGTKTTTIVGRQRQWLWQKESEAHQLNANQIV